MSARLRSSSYRLVISASRRRSWRGKCAGPSVTADEVVAQLRCLDDADALRQHRPGRGLVGGVEAARAQTWQLCLGFGDEWVALGDVRPAASIYV